MEPPHQLRMQVIAANQEAAIFMCYMLKGNDLRADPELQFIISYKTDKTRHNNLYWCSDKQILISYHMHCLRAMNSSLRTTVSCLCSRLIVPMLQGYEDAADFTMSKRLKTSIRGNLIFYASVGTIGIVGAVILLATKELAWENLVTLAIGASNAFGLVTGALLLGFGLVEIPHNLWRHADLDARQKWLSHKVAKVADKLDEAHQELSTAVVVGGLRYFSSNLKET